MKILIDTHTFIWFVEDDDKLPEQLKEIIANPANEIYLSIASLWEMAIKIQLKKLKIDKTIKKVIDSALDNGFELLPILPEHIIKLVDLKFFHRDPFDRIIIAQSLIENSHIISKDIVFDNYGVRRMWT